MRAEEPQLGGSLAAVVVLYGAKPFESEALSSLAGLARDRAGLPFRIMVWDNSPVAHANIPQDLPLARLVREPKNPGLAVPYNAALRWARGKQCSWLILFDQDTVVTRAYVDAVMTFAERHENDSSGAPRVGLGYPRLQQGDRVLSPTSFPRLRAKSLPMTRELEPPRKLMILNSGSVVSVEAAEAVGGFPSRYPLDALDHAFVSELRRADFKAEPLPVFLEHHASTTAMRAMSRSRFESIVQAETQYFTEYGSRSDKFWLMVRRLLRLLQVLTQRRESPSLHVEIDALRSALHASLNGDGPRR